MKKLKSCKICGNPDKGFYSLNENTQEYSGIEIAISSMGYLRCRANYGDNSLSGQSDVIEIKYCPNCGKKIGKEQVT